MTAALTAFYWLLGGVAFFCAIVGCIGMVRGNWKWESHKPLLITAGVCIVLGLLLKFGLGVGSDMSYQKYFLAPLITAMFLGLAVALHDLGVKTWGWKSQRGLAIAVFIGFVAAAWIFKE